MERKTLICLTAVVLVVLLGAGFTLFMVNNTERTETAKLEAIAADEADPAVWGLHYPRHYEVLCQMVLVSILSDFSW